MLLSVISDTHDQSDRTRYAIDLFVRRGCNALIHCGNITTPAILEACFALPTWFTFGNHDTDSVVPLRNAAKTLGMNCLEWGDVIDIAGHRIGIVHGHMRSDRLRVEGLHPEVIFSGHFHFNSDAVVNSVRRINPGALHDSENFTVALFELNSGSVEFCAIA